jgi:prolyl oligopeptidase PreP (S9A serine peptidase family)
MNRIRLFRMDIPVPQKAVDWLNSSLETWDFQKLVECVFQTENFKWSLLVSFAFAPRILKAMIPASKKRDNEEDSHEILEKKIDRVNYWLDKDAENLFLTEVTSDESLTWVKELNAKCLQRLGDPTNSELFNTIVNILENKEKIPHVTKNGHYYYNFWQDEDHPHGIYRRTTWESYLLKEIRWEIVFDIDEMCKVGNESWVYKGNIPLPMHPDINPEQLERRLILLSKNQNESEYFIIKEFDVLKMCFLEETQCNNNHNNHQNSANDSSSYSVSSFTTDNSQSSSISNHVSSSGSFTFLSPGKHIVSWKDANTLLIGPSTTIPSHTLKKTGYSRMIREWKRGSILSENDSLDTSFQALQASSQASTIIAMAEEEDLMISSIVTYHREYVYQWISRSLNINHHVYQLKILFDPSLPSTTANGGGGGGAVVRRDEWYKLAVPNDSEVDIFADQLLIVLKSNWILPSCNNSNSNNNSANHVIEYLAGSLLAVPVKAFLSHQSLGKL